MALTLSRYYLRERTCNAVYEIVKEHRRDFVPLYYIADGNPAFFSHLKNFFNFFLQSVYSAVDCPPAHTGFQDNFRNGVSHRF